MTGLAVPGWWQSPRAISVVVDHDSWILQQAEALVRSCASAGDEAILCRDHGDVLADSQPDSTKTIAEPFGPLRMCDSERSPAYLDHRGARFTVNIEPDGRESLR